MNSCWILSTPRTGSSYLSDLLNSTKIWGDKSTNDEATKKNDRFTEYYCPRFFREGYLTKPPRFNKINWHQLVKHFGRSFQIEAHLPDIKLVLIRRKNFTGVAVSKYIAKRLSSWISETSDSPEERWNVHDQKLLDDFQSVRIPINTQELSNLYRRAVRQYSIWDNYLHDRKFIEFDFEDIINEPKSTVCDILSYIGTNGSPNLNWEKLPLRINHPIKSKLLEILRLKSFL